MRLVGMLGSRVEPSVELNGMCGEVVEDVELRRVELDWHRQSPIVKERARLEPSSSGWLTTSVILGFQLVQQGSNGG